MLSVQKGLLLFFVALPSACSIASRSGVPSFECMEGKSYYHLVDGYSCRVNSPDRARVSSWKGRIEVVDGRLTVWGDVCNDAPVYSKNIESDLRVAEDCQSVSFMGNRYVHLDAPPETSVLKGETE